MPRNRTGHGSDKRITPRMSRAIDALLNGEAETITEAARIAGIRREQVSRTLKEPHCTAEIQRRIKTRLKTVGAIKAANTLDRLVSHATSEYVQLDAAKTVLAINGVRPATDAAQMAAGGIAVRLVINGQALNVAAIAGQFGAASAQPDMSEPQAIEEQRRLQLEHSLSEGAGEVPARIEGGRADE